MFSTRRMPKQHPRTVTRVGLPAALLFTHKDPWLVATVYFSSATTTLRLCGVPSTSPSLILQFCYTKWLRTCPILSFRLSHSSDLFSYWSHFIGIEKVRHLFSSRDDADHKTSMEHGHMSLHGMDGGPVAEFLHKFCSLEQQCYQLGTNMVRHLWVSTAQDSIRSLSPMFVYSAIRIFIGSSVAILAASLCINRRLYHISKCQAVTVTKQEVLKSIPMLCSRTYHSHRNNESFSLIC